MKEQTEPEGAEEARELVPETSDAFRETFLFVFDPEDAKVFRQFIDLVQDRLLDRSRFVERHPHSSYTLAEMLAVEADLSFLESFLRNVAAERRWSELTSTEQDLSELAERFAPQVAALARALEQEVGHLISDDEESAPAGAATPSV